MKLSYSYIVIVLLAIIAVSLQARQDNVVSFEVRDFCKLNFKDCGSGVGKPISVTFNGTCTSAGVAVLKKGTVVVINFQFQSYDSEAVLTSVVHGSIEGSPWIRFPLGDPDACKNSGLNCPIPANTTLNYTPVLKVLDSYPAVNVIVKWELQNAKKNDVFCIVMPAEITN
ncbi:hypothetical protein BsWGS_10099 [Bradybaena similaris]